MAAAAAPDVCTVLVVEDDPDSREALTRFLGVAGCMVRATATVGEALLLLEEWEPSHVLLDLALPDAGGVVLLRAIRRRNIPVRVALVTASGPHSASVADARRWHPDAIFHKPLVFADIEAWLMES
jgi:DNA-binding response OmpR family regulator